MSPEFVEKWEHILQDIEKSKVPIFFIKKIILKLQGKKQKTINVEKLILQGLDPIQLENVVSKQLDEFNDNIIGVEFSLNVEAIADMVQPETDRILNKL
jgi:3-deoxy-D-manno-octulosonic acid (KDO) 8-phosphate synthase